MGRQESKQGMPMGWLLVKQGGDDEAWVNVEAEGMGINV